MHRDETRALDDDTKHLCVPQDSRMILPSGDDVRSRRRSLICIAWRTKYATTRWAGTFASAKDLRSGKVEVAIMVIGLGNPRRQAEKHAPSSATMPFRQGSVTLDCIGIAHSQEATFLPITWLVEAPCPGWTEGAI